MSFPTTVSEFVELSEKALKLYKRCRDSAGDHRKLAPPTRQLANILQDFDDLIIEEKFDSTRQGELMEHGQACNELLSDLDLLLQKYDHLPTQSKRAWDRLNWDEQGLRSIRTRLLGTIEDLTGFYTEITTSSRSQVESALSQLIKDYQGGHREAGSVLSMTTTGSDDEDSPWPQIQQDLEDLGISAAVSDEYRSFITAWFARAISDGLLQSNPLDDKYLCPAPLSTSRPSSKKSSSESITTPEHSPPVPLGPPPPLSPPSRPPVPVTPPYPLDEPTEVRMPLNPPYPTNPPIAAQPRNRASMPPKPSPSSPKPLRYRASMPSRAGPPTRAPPPVPGKVASQMQSHDFGEDTMKFLVLPPPEPGQEDEMKYFVKRKPLSDEPLPHQEDPIAFPRGSDQEPPIPVPPDHTLPMAIHGLDDPIPLSMEDTSTNIIWTAQKIVRHWNQREWEKAEAQLQQQLADVLDGVTIEIKGIKRAPEARLLRYLLGICASFRGDYGRAKQWFDGVLRTPYDFGRPMDEGDISAARWLGDACLMLNEPHNAALAYAIALDGQDNNLGPTSDRTRVFNRTMGDLREVQARLKGLTRLNAAFEQMDDISNIYNSTSPFVKGRVVHELLVGPKFRQSANSGDNILGRMPTSIQIDEGYLIQPLITFAKWPIQWDPFFNAREAVQLLCDMHNIITHPMFAPRPRHAIDLAAIPTIALGHSDSMHFVTKRDAPWLADTLRAVLRTHGLDYVERSDHFICKLIQQTERISYHETLVIKLRRLPMRKTYGVKVAHVRNRSRAPAFSHSTRSDFADLIGASLAVAEAEADA